MKAESTIGQSYTPVNAVGKPAGKLGARKTLAAIANRLRRAARVGNYWYWLDAPELANGIEIAALIAPLRYDVLIRRDFLAFYADHRGLYVSDFAAFIQAARQGPYYRWFMSSEAIRCKRELLTDADALEQEFVQRVRRAAGVYEDMLAHGFRPQSPIILKTAEQLLPPTTDPQGAPSGKQVSARYFLADGCHRLAMLLLLGYTLLPAEYLQVKCFRRFSPFDSTSLLARSLTLEPDAYFRFLSGRYCAPAVCTDKAQFLDYIQQHKPKFMAEVTSILRVDGFE
ncbi:MAG: hypothetical protein JOZ51_02580 [Chloroflexi bacterium]|nr:hypothetical protein [Chloroflexota bacterium]